MQREPQQQMQQTPQNAETQQHDAMEQEGPAPSLHSSTCVEKVETMGDFLPYSMY
jgi:hypothetical protein